MTIPHHAKPVFTGNQFKIYQWEETLFDGSKAIFEAAVRANSVKAIAVTNVNTILVNKEEQPGKGSFMALPGGLMEEDESPESAIQRELFEETGYKPGSLELLMTESAGYRLECDRFTFIARGCQKRGEPHLDAGEKIEVLELSVDDFVEAILDGKIRARDLQRIFLIEYRKDPNLTELKKKLLDVK